MEKPTEASPETNEQFEIHESDILNQGVKFSFPPNSKMSFGLALPQLFFNKKLITNKRLNNVEKNIKKTSVFLKLILKKIFFIGRKRLRIGNTDKYKTKNGKIIFLIITVAK